MQPICETGLWQAMIPAGRVEQAYRLHTFDADGRHDDKLDTYAFDVSFIKDAPTRPVAVAKCFSYLYFIKASLRQGLFLDGFNRNGNGDIITHVRCIFAHIEVSTFDDSGGVSAASVFFKHWVRHALEGCHRQRHRFADPF